MSSAEAISEGASFTVNGQWVDLETSRIVPASIEVVNGRIHSITPVDKPAAAGSGFFAPGLVDAHVHIESSLLAPTEFARAAVVHGTVATVSDPHEIANVCGLEGVRWMLENAARSPVHFCFGAPSCVPATVFETAGAALDLEAISALLDDPAIGYLAEVMNFPGVLNGDPLLHGAIRYAQSLGKPVDGHAPGLVGEPLRAYAAAGIETDHEAVTLDEARQRIATGMRVAIREGSAARNFDALWPVLREAPEQCFFCSDDKHPDDLVVSHINALVARAVANGVDLFDALRVATVNPVRHYKLPVGLLRPGDRADFVEFEDLREFRVRRCWIGGRLVAENGASLLPREPMTPINRFAAGPITEAALRIAAPPEGGTLPIIVALDGQLLTRRIDEVPTVRGGHAVADTERDLLKIAVVNRYQDAAPALGLIRGFGLRSGAIAGSVAHDSHNIVAVGADDTDLRAAVNAVIAGGGGLSFAEGGDIAFHPLPVAGLMGTGDAWEAAEAFTILTRRAKEAGCDLRSPYMTLSFMALLVIPSLKIGDRGLFDVDRFAFVEQ